MKVAPHSHMNKRAYIYFVTLFALAKKAKDYELADLARAELHKYQQLPDQKFLQMHEDKRYTWHPVFA